MKKKALLLSEQEAPGRGGSTCGGPGVEACVAHPRSSESALWPGRSGERGSGRGRGQGEVGGAQDLRSF